MGKIRDELAEWFTVLSRYVGMTGLVFEVTTHHNDPAIVTVLAAMMGIGHIFPSRTARAMALEEEERRREEERRVAQRRRQFDHPDEETPR